MKIKEYYLNFAMNSGSMAEDVNQMLADGWSLHGPTIPCDIGYSQAMVKYEEPLCEVVSRFQRKTGLIEALQRIYVLALMMKDDVMLSRECVRATGAEISELVIVCEKIVKEAG